MIKIIWDKLGKWTKPIKEKIQKKKEEKKLIETTVTIRTSYLEKEVKNLCNFKIGIALLTFLGSILTAIIAFYDFGGTICAFFSKETTLTDISIGECLICVISILMISLALYSFFSSYKVHNSITFVNNIIKDQYDIEEYTAIFIIKGIWDNIPQILVFRSETWKSFFLPYCHYDKKISEKEIKEKVRKPLAEQLEIDENDIEIFDDFAENKYVAIKKNPTHKKMSKMNYRFFYVKFKDQYAGRKFLNNNYSHYFCWKSKYELINDMDTQLNNGDVISIIDELALINQSQVAFQENQPSSYEISSRYSIIWNITNDCHFNCPICATNSAQNSEEKRKHSITKEDKITILLNLSSINGFIECLDISGGDPLKNDEDRYIIKKANQILAYTDIRVSTTGKSLENISVNELIDTVKKCDITYDIPYEVRSDELLQKYRDYYYNYYNFRQLEKLCNSGVKIELNIHVPILPVTTDEKLIEMIIEDIRKINPAKVKFIRLMPVGRMTADKVMDNYKPEEFLKIVNKVMRDKKYRFNISYNCSLGVRIESSGDDTKTVKNCGMLTRKLGIDCEGRVYACIWGAYIPEYADNESNNPFYIGDLKKETMFEILTNPSTLKLLKNLESMQKGCRVCAYVNERKTYTDSINKDKATAIMLSAQDPLETFREYNVV